MNWGIRVVGRAADISDLIDNATTGLDEESAEVVEQVKAAKEGAHALLNSGCVGEGDVIYSIGLGGYANPEHLHREGYTNDNTNIQVFLATEEQLTEFEEA